MAGVQVEYISRAKTDRANHAPCKNMHPHYHDGDPRLHGTSIAGSILSLIGSTPIVALPRLAEEIQASCILAVKHEATNPGGSAKDRPALQMILDAEARGDLHRGDTIVEPTSGNTGVGLAIVAAQRGYQCVFVVTDKVAPEKIALLSAYGAEVIVCPVAVPPDDPRSYYSVAERITAERGAYRPDQYHNPSNPRAHEATTGPEIWEQTQGRITHFVAGAGTSGTISGVARYLRSRNRDIEIIVADPDRSVFSGGSGRPYLVEGVGEDFYPAAWDRNLYSAVIPISDGEAFSVARRVSRVEGLLVGGSGGLALAAAIRVAERCGPDDLIVVLNPDSGRGYLSRVYSDAWMTTNGFITVEAGPWVRDILHERGDAPFISVHPDATIREAIDALEASGGNGVPVCIGDFPYAPAEVVGFVDATAVATGVSRGLPTDATVASIMRTDVVAVGSGDSIDAALERVGEGFGVVFDEGRSAGLLSARDIMLYHGRVNKQLEQSEGAR